MKTLVTGGGGFSGSELIYHRAAEHRDVRSISLDDEVDGCGAEILGAAAVRHGVTIVDLCARKPPPPT